MILLIGQIEFLHPLRLAAAILVLLIVVAVWRTTTMIPLWQRFAATVFRVSLFLLLVVALARPVQRGETDQQQVVFVRDISHSAAGASEAVADFVQRAQSQQDHHETRFLAFAGKPSQPAADPTAIGEQANSLVPGESAPDEALLLAAGLIPPDRVGKIVLQTDGRQTRGDLFAAAQGVHVPVLVVPVEPFCPADVSVDHISSPPHVRPREPFALAVSVTANCETSSTVELLRNGEKVDSRAADLIAGDNQVLFRTQLTGPSRTVFTARVTAERDSLAQNNQRRVVVMADDPPQALVVAENEAAAQPLLETLRLAGFQPTLERPGEIRSNNQLRPNDLVVLYDVSPSAFSPNAAGALKGYLEGGGGLIVVGGKTTFAQDVYRESALEPLLPVNALKRPQERRPTVALVLVIDRSDSMKNEGRMPLARQAAQKVVGVLTSEDKVGVIVFGDDSDWISDLAGLSDKAAVNRRIAAIQPKGVTNMYPALEKAYVALQQEDADRRNVIVLTDGVPSPGDFDRLARAMAAAGIKVSTVTVSPGADQTIMKDIADLAGGRHDHCDDPQELSDILQREAEQATALPARVEYRPFVLRALPGLDLANVEPLTGYTPTSPKPRSEVLLTTPEGDPLLCWWRYGQGVAVAVTSSETAGRPWQKWPGYRTFWSRLARHAVRQNDPSEPAVDVQPADGGIFVTLDMGRATGSLIDRVQVLAQVVGPGESGRPAELPPVAPGRWGCVLSVDERPDPYDLEVKIAAGGKTLFKTRRGVVRDYPAEFRLGGVDGVLLKNVASVTGGVYNPQPEEVFADDGRRAPTLTEWWPPLVIAALLLFVLDVWLRRARFASRVRPPEDASG